MDKGVCGKGSIWNPSNCECECDKSYDVREYLDYENCQCRKKIADKLVEECTENIDAYFVYSRWYLKKMFLVLSLATVLKQQFGY